MVKKTTPSTLSLSNLHERFAALQQEHQWLLKQIKRKRTEVNNFVNQMRSVALEAFEKTAPIYQKASNLDQEIHELFNEIFTTRKFGKQSKRQIEEIYQTLQVIGLISHRMEDEEDDEGEEFDELFEFDEEEMNEFNQEAKNYYQQYRGENKENFEPARAKKDSKNIRHIFLKLAEKFHPDKVNDSETQARHTEIMKELNRAYQEGDLATLLEIEKNHQIEEILFSQDEDEQTRRCNRLEKDNIILKEQYEHLKLELRLAKNTPEGQMVQDYRKAKKQGIDMIAEMIKVLEKELKELAKIRDFVLQFKNKKMTIKEFLKGPRLGHQMSKKEQQEIMEEILEELILGMNFSYSKLESGKTSKAWFLLYPKAHNLSS